MSRSVDGAESAARLADPVAEYRREKGLWDAEHTLVRWTADINGDGHPEMFLCLVASYLDDKRDGQVPSWLAYIATADGAGYHAWAGREDRGEVIPTFPKIDPERLYIGRISQLKTRGIVTAHSEVARTGEGTTEVFAYTVAGKDWKETHLASFDHLNERNAVYERYLGKGRRTAVELQEIVP